MCVIIDLNQKYIFGYIMPIYINRTLTEVVFGLRCPFCSNKYKSKSGVITHAKHCSENTDPDISLVDIIVWKDNSAIDMINWEDEITKLAKELIVSNELALIQTQTPEQIRETIRYKMKQRTFNNYIEEFDIYRIYEFFFGLTETDINKRTEEACYRMRNLLFPQDDSN
jgi:hypothetical protein